jgi:hypothetical protein
MHGVASKRGVNVRFENFEDQRRRNPCYYASLEGEVVDGEKNEQANRQDQRSFHLLSPLTAHLLSNKRASAINPG